LLCFLTQAQSRDLLPDTLIFCYGDSGWVQLRSATANDAVISWNTPQGIITNTRKVNARKEGRYVVRVSGSGYDAPVYDSAFVRINNKVRPLLNDTFMCKGKSIVLDAHYPGLKYQWSTGENSQKIRIEAPGRYWVKILNGTCVTIDSVKVKVLSGAGTVLNSDQTFCLNEQDKILQVKVNPGTKILWQNGVTTPTLQITKEGTYIVRTEANNCGAEIDSVKVKFKVCECEMMIPNSFTPNEDNRNDYFFPVTQCDYSQFNITITDRWGNTVYYSNNVNARWDGRYKGNLCPEDIYTYRIETSEKVTEKKQVRHGQISLFR